MLGKNDLRHTSAMDATAIERQVWRWLDVM
jgi:hypothetical protein